MNTSYIFLLIIFSIGLLSKSDLLVLASIVLFILKLIRFDNFLVILDNFGIKIGLLFLLLSVMVPLVDGSISLVEIIKSYKSIIAVFALVSGLLATKVVGMGIILLEREPELIVGMLLGSIIGIVFFNGVPTGPLLAAGLTAIFYQLYSLLFN
ncbi:uncharacterized membrane protein (DUF441 family) [Orenia metallireducens]|uniref:UPF0756 membrane protein SAMN06265827_11331 n=1 Tax=Orenia metallireducens TaxID=1413210 RepID=A0A285H298_9FIRM|nr:DUF441 domain-containing protein [Orenia metallireducens]PRX29447.1 uncharacterized membrane protein (DUF441 family) [Orenia metallireducens]SNY29902.1 Uncharacterized membrane protein, DUF441 family [Orenia metallireducens]